MKILLKILCILTLLLPTTAFALEDNRFPASIVSVTDTTATVSTTRAPQIGEYYSAACGPYTGKEEYDGFTKNTTFTITNLTKGVLYTCRMYIYPSDTGGYTQGTSQDLVFIAGEPYPASGITTENRKPTIQSVHFADGSGPLTEGAQVIFAVSAIDPDFDAYQLRFFACKVEGTACMNAMNGSQEAWTYQNTFAWTPPSTGDYRLTVIVRDGYHADATNPYGDHETTLNFSIRSKAEGGQNPFPDTDITQLSGQAAAELSHRGVIGGYPDGEFKSYRLVNRAEAAKFLLLARFGSIGDVPNSRQFWDIPDGQWFTKYIVTAGQLGIISGYADGSFRAGETVNTAEFLKMLTLTFGLEENLNSAYQDVSPDAWYARYAGVVAKYNLFPDRYSYLQPGSTLTREEVAIAIYQYLSRQ